MFKSLFEIENFETSVAVQRHSRAKLYIRLVSINYVPLVAPISSNFQWYIFPPINGEPIVENLSTMAENEFRFDRPRNS